MGNFNYRTCFLLSFLKISNSRTLKWLLGFLCLFSFQYVTAQSVSPPRDSYISIDNSIGTVMVSLEDSTNVSEIEVNLGSKNSFNDLFSHSYTFDNSTGLPSGLTYTRQNLNIFLGVGTLNFPTALNVKVRIKDNSGNWSSYLEYISN